MNEPIVPEKITSTQWECPWHGVQGAVGLTVNNSHFCATCIEKLLLDKLYPLKEKKID